MNQTNYDISESAGSVMVCAEILSTTGNLECDVDASVSTLNGSAMGKHCLLYCVKLLECSPIQLVVTTLLCPLTYSASVVDLKYWVMVTVCQL